MTNTLTIKISKKFGEIRVWDIKEALMMRDECRVMGRLVGFIPRYPKLKGIPLMLTFPELVTLLKEFPDIVKLRVRMITSFIPCPEVVKRFHEDMENNRILQSRLATDKRRKNRWEYLKSKGENIDLKDVEVKEVVLTLGQVRVSKSKVTPRHLERPGQFLDVDLPNFTSLGDVIFFLLRHPEMGPAWAADASRNVLQSAAYHFLWRSQSLDCPVTTVGAMKFGGNFLLYPGDPMERHALYVVAMTSDREWSSSRPGDWLGRSRVAGMVRKTLLLLRHKDTKLDINDWRSAADLSDVLSRLEFQLDKYTGPPPYRYPPCLGPAPPL